MILTHMYSHVDLELYFDVNIDKDLVLYYDNNSYRLNVV